MWTRRIQKVLYALAIEKPGLYHEIVITSTACVKGRRCSAVNFDGVSVNITEFKTPSKQCELINAACEAYRKGGESFST